MATATTRKQRPVLPCDACGRSSGWCDEGQPQMFSFARRNRHPLVTTRTGGTYRPPVTCRECSRARVFDVACPQPGHQGAIAPQVAFDAGGGCVHCESRCPCLKSSAGLCLGRPEASEEAAGSTPPSLWLCLGGCGTEAMRDTGALAWCSTCWWLDKTLSREAALDVAVLRSRHDTADGFLARVADLLRRTGVEDAERLIERVETAVRPSGRRTA